MDKNFETLGSATDRVVEKLERKMQAQRDRHYQAPATEETKRLTRRMLGEKDDD